MGRRFAHIAVLGITGGVGAGKSTILEYLKKHYGAVIIECDEVGRSLQQEGGACYLPMVQLFGRQILQEDGAIDRKMAARMIFEDPEKKKELEQIVHPAVKAEVRRQLEELDREGVTKSTVQKLAVIESALLIDDHYEELCDEIWYIYTADEKRRSRLKSSRHYSDERIDRMFAAQRGDESFRRHAQITIDNTDDIVQNTLKQLDIRIAERFPECRAIE